MRFDPIHLYAFHKAFFTKRAFLRDLLLETKDLEKEWSKYAAQFPDFDFKNEYQALITQDIQLVSFLDLNIPFLENANPPVICLYTQGDLNLLNANVRRFAVVGSRNCTDYGIKNTQKFTGSLINAGCTIVSGLAYGIDKVAHQTANQLKSQNIAVLASGAGDITPRQHKDLAKGILENNGLIITEYPPGFKPEPYRFPERNRIIAAISEGILVPEAREKSGALITARYGLKMGKNVYGIPGSIHNSVCHGVNNLISEGGVALNKPEDLLQHLDIQQPSQASENIFNKLSDKYIKVLKFLSHDRISIDDLSDKSCTSNAELMTLLYDLDDLDIIEIHQGVSVCLK